MNAPADLSDEQVRARRLRRWTWAMAAAAWALIAVMGSSLKVAPYLVADAFSKLLGVGVVIGVLAYFVVRGEPEYRKARGYWVGVLVILLGVAPAIFLAQRMEQRHEAEKVNAIVREMGESLKKADQEFSESVKSTFKEATRAVLAGEAILDAAARKDARGNLAEVIAIVDESLAKRARIPQKAIAQIEATTAAERLKLAMVGEIRAATEKRDVLSVQMMKGTRAFLAKFDELIAHVDRSAPGIELRGGQIEFSDVAASDRYNELQSELAALQAELQRLQSGVKKE